MKPGLTPEVRNAALLGLAISATLWGLCIALYLL